MKSTRIHVASRLMSLCVLMLLLAAGGPVSGQDELDAVPQVQAIPDAIRQRFNLAPFYQKYLDLDGLPVLGSGKVSDYAMREAAWIIRHMLAAHPQILNELTHRGVRVVVMAYNEYTTDLPEQADMTPKVYWDRRARGLGGQISSCAEENLLCFPTDPYNRENILIHEFSHTVHRYGLSQLIPDFDQRLTAAYANAMSTGLWKNTYSATNRFEYWAEAVQCWFDCANHDDAWHTWVRTREQLKQYDPAIAALCAAVYGDGPWRYSRPQDRTPDDRAHLAGYDRTKAPTFKWRTPDAAADPLPKPVILTMPMAAQPLPLSAVRLTGGPLQHAQQLDADYLLKLEPDRMLYYLRERAGLQPKASEGYGGWDGDGRQLTGHIAGHYLSAVSYMYAATGDPRFKQRADYIVSELKEIQDKQGDGYIGALMASVREPDGTIAIVPGKQRFQDLANGLIQSSGFDLNGMWSPWYVEHKLFAGLRDAYRYTGNRTALDVEVKFAGWVEDILSKLDPDQIQKMLSTEFGGMNEVTADLYADTGDRRWLALSDKFEQRAVLEPLANHQDRLGGLHANTQIPKLIGSLARYIDSGNTEDLNAAEFFWDTVTEHHTFATGGHGKDEYFNDPDKLANHIDGRTAESCNVYNMLKMTRTLFALEPDIKYAEYQERALFNHVLASMDPVNGATCYMVPVGRGVTHEYQDLFASFTCCVGTGMENHALHGYGIYYVKDDKAWINLYTPSTADWPEKGVRFEVQTDLPEGESAKVIVHVQTPALFTLSLRRPSWAGDGFTVAINGTNVQTIPGPANYVELTRQWKESDTVALNLPKTLHLEPLPDNPSRVAILWGPLVLAGDLGPEDRRGDLPVPALVSDDTNVSDWLKPVPGQPGAFRTNGVGHAEDVTLIPFYRLQRRTYCVYWDLLSTAQWQVRAQAIAAEAERQRQLELATVAFVQPGEMQPERDFNQQGEDTTPDRVMGRAARRGSKWFSFDLPVDPTHPAALVATYYSDEWRTRTFDITVDGQTVGQQTVGKSEPAAFFDVTYSVPAALIAGKQKVTVRFQATNRNEIAAVFGLRMIRADAPIPPAPATVE